MKKFFILCVLFAVSVPLVAQNIKEIIQMADNVALLNYTHAMAQNFGVTAADFSAKANVILGSDLSGNATAMMEFSKSLEIQAAISKNEFGITLSFDPFSYTDSTEKLVREEMSSKMKIRREVIDVFFDAMKISRELEYLSHYATSLSAQAKIALLKVGYSYDLNLLSVLVGEKIKRLEFPDLNVPKIPGEFSPHVLSRDTNRNYDVRFQISANFSRTLTLGVGIKYSWSPKSEPYYVPNVLNVEKERLYMDLKVLANVVKEYDKRIAALFKKYSQIYGDYLNGQSTKKEVDNISNEIAQTGYVRDIYCIKLLKTWYLYTYFGE